ncbi:hypothetical protein I6A84_38455 [Frankia sp. CNm7]|uniref:Secreted protein n=1 Tax=Frankia nepalensis TaxID=1836974 RepID=A0A937RFY8_9ACTN|nr:hypothetical protein [Frankia nepalensis]MBL7495788.1 hypothetical protein [Frankia nepalensis]MBL7513278.1 hypothetical protein [Frankia nepalensis]MBL7523770.1 hypothetical protein [Frankia nepalensis]MBL7628159.1 hypothetical protein [Frankia nepalensis]
MLRNRLVKAGAAAVAVVATTGVVLLGSASSASAARPDYACGLASRLAYHVITSGGTLNHEFLEWFAETC